MNDDLELSNYEFLIYSCDWVNCINDGISYDDMLILLDSNGIKFEEKHEHNVHYVTIKKESFYLFFALLTSTSAIRITRVDIKFDLPKKYDDILPHYIEVWTPSKVVGDNEGIQTMYFGSRNSDLYSRFYNKTVEAGLDYDLSRLEFEVKGAVCRQFSLRYSLIGSDDAVNYLMGYIKTFCYKHFLDRLINFDNFGDYVNFSIVDKKSTVDKFKRFLKQYSSSILLYFDEFNLSPEEFEKLCTRELSFEDRIIRGS